MGKHTIVCRDHENTSSPKDLVKDWARIEKVYDEIMKPKYSKSSNAERMVDNTGSRIGWACYHDQPIYANWSEWNECVNGIQVRSRDCLGSCDDMVEQQNC